MGFCRHSRGVVLVFVAGILTILAAMGTSFYAISYSSTASAVRYSDIWRGGDVPMEGLPCGLSNTVVLLDEDPLHCLIADYAFALAHSGTRHLPVVGAGGPNRQAQFTRLQQHAAATKARGVRNMPTILPCCEKPLKRPPSGRPEDTRPESGPVVNALLKLAEKARPQRPVVVVCAGSTTEVVSAWLRNRSCADRFILVLGYKNEYIPVRLDPWALEIAVRRFRCIVFQKTYKIGIPPERFAQIRDSRWKQVVQREVSMDVPLLAAVALPGFARKVERARCVPDGPGNSRFETDPDGRIWLVHDVDMPALKQDVIQTFWGY